MSSGQSDSELPVVPGLGPADGSRAERDAHAGGPAVFDPQEHTPRVLGAADDPDRFDPGRLDPDHAQPAPTSRRMDPAQDPDRFLPPGQGQSLVDLLGKAGAQEEERDNYQWAVGLLCVLGFLALVAYLFQEVLSP